MMNQGRSGCRGQLTRAALTALFGAVLAAAPAVVEAQKTKTGPTPVAATFRCPTDPDLGCLTEDTLRGDSPSAYVGRPLTGPNDPGEGAYINGNGGLSLVLVPETSDRGLVIELPPDQDGGCERGFSSLRAIDAILQLNAGVGLRALKVDESVQTFGKLNFKNTSPDGYFWTVRFPQGTVAVTRTGEKTWTFDVDTQIAGLQCTTTSRKTVITDDGFVDMRFRIFVAEP